ncbi:hypothetical protein DEU56DRAFT_977202 [Suillus clintonianus]|uniref:uncharacterized protein n=1 Tax=Suillus clintonianus TaxID=1904413 RepID=UPI001B87CA39|nr:uncharacterized protein DEU56DRAFT_977202 [Suillus clintonianus]KAG2152813.1 hypothetical protein DEU56DRAFT_977202 [Suillus clintonianus]
MGGFPTTSASIAATTGSHDDLKDLVQEVFDEYITNEMPIRLLHITKHDQKTKFKLVDRAFVRNHFESVPDIIHGEFAQMMLVNGEDREDRIRERVKKELKYAIFSHRWLPGEQEPLYDHMSNQPMDIPDDPEPGWEKLQIFCRTAKDVHKCEFAWSDTCCIDKKSSAELDESIRSMFRWYRNSYICIAFLSETADLAALQMQEKGERGEKARIDAWFIRGWTLQELLAPSQIKFYGSHWKPLIQGSTNDRDSEAIMRKISELTDIHMNDLISFTPGTDRVPEKMLWASRRRTTRIEDIAYCLIGIFDISLMIAYGEGNRAFFRLLEEILKRYDKWDVFLWSGRCSRYNAALPNAPHCYAAGCTETLPSAVDEIGDRRFALTNHGLEIRVLLLAVQVEDITEELPDSRCLSFRHDYFRVKVRHIGPKRERRDTAWAIGVLDYRVDGEDGSIDRSGKIPFTGFLLSSDAHASPHLAATARWKKEMTKEVIKICCPDHVPEHPTLLYL